MNDDYEFYKNICGEKECSREIEIPLSLFIGLAECRGRMCAMRDYAKAHKYHFSSSDLSIICGFDDSGEKKNADM